MKLPADSWDEAGRPLLALLPIIPATTDASAAVLLRLVT